MIQRENEAKKGHRFEGEIENFVRKVIGKNPNVDIYRNDSRGKNKHEIQGASYHWYPDIQVIRRLTANSKFPKYLAIINCKHIKEKPNRGTYWTELSRAYMELNDLKLNPKLGNPKYFMIVNRYRMTGEVDKNYPLLFKNIGVSMISFNDDSERERFARILQRISKINL